MTDLKTLYNKTEQYTVDSTTFRNSVTGTTGTGSLVFNNGATLTGTPTSVTPTGGDESNKIATTAFVATEISSFLSGFNLLTLSGTSHTLNLGSGKYFDGGTLVGDTNVVFTNIPAGSSKWTYTFKTGWNVTDVNNVIYANSDLSVNSQESTPTGIAFRPDGYKMYMSGFAGGVHQYDLTYPWDLTRGVSYDASFNNTAQGLFFNKEGTKLYTSTETTVNQYSLSIPWDVTTGVTSDGSYSISGQTTTGSGLFFSSSGDKFYICAFTVFNSRVYQYSLTTPWDITSGVGYDGSYDVQDSSVEGVIFSNDGQYMYTAGNSDFVHQYKLSVPWDVTIANNVTFEGGYDAGNEDPFIRNCIFKDDGTRLYVAGSNTDQLIQYEIVPYKISLPTSVRNFDYSAVKPGINTLEFFTNDGGTNIYISKHYIS